MYFPFYIARRYLIAKKSHNIINIISLIAIGGVTIGTMALVVALSAFNGLENLVLSLYNSFDPDIKILPKTGKTFNPADLPLAGISKIKGVAFYTEVIEENVLIKYRDKRHVATIRGVSDNFLKYTGINERMVSGEFALYRDNQPAAILGYDIAYKLSLNPGDQFNPLTFYVPKKNISMASLSPENAFNEKGIVPAGIFSIQQEFDTKYVIVPIAFARDLLGIPGNVSCIELRFTGNMSDNQTQQIRDAVQNLAGKNFSVLDRFRQHELLYKIMKSEKWAVFFILAFILIIATFNIIGSLTMLIFDKRNDIAILRSMGAGSATIRRIFFMEGMLISNAGNIAGLISGIILCILQSHYKLIKFTGNVIIDAYPVSMEWPDFVYIFLTVFLIGLLATYFPVKQITLKYSAVRQSAD